MSLIITKVLPYIVKVKRVLEDVLCKVYQNIIQMLMLLPEREGGGGGSSLTFCFLSCSITPTALVTCVPHDETISPSEGYSYMAPLSLIPSYVSGTYFTFNIEIDFSTSTLGLPDAGPTLSSLGT